MKKRELLKDLAKQRFYGVVNLAFEEARKGRWEIASELGRQAFRIAKKGGYKVPRKVKRRFCRRCFIPLIPGITARIRIRNKGYPTVVVTCLNCGYVRRYPARHKREVAEREKGKHEGAEGGTEPDQAHGPHRQEGRDRRGDQGDQEAT